MATMFHNIVNALVYSDDLIFVLFSFIYLFIYLFIYSSFFGYVYIKVNVWIINN